MHHDLRRLAVFVFEFITEFAPAEGLYACCFEILIQFTKELGKASSLRFVVGQLGKVRDVRLLKEILNLGEELVDPLEVMHERVGKEFHWLTIRVHLHCAVYVASHGVGTTIVTDDPKGFVGTEETIGAAEGLDDVFILHHFIHIERVDPLRVETREHLIDHNKEVQLCLRFEVAIGLFVGKSERYVYLILCIGGQRVVHSEECFIPFEYLHQAIFFDGHSLHIVDARVEERRNFEFWTFFSEQTIVGYCLGNAPCGKDGVKLTALAQHIPILLDVVHHGKMMLLVAILAFWQKVLYAFHILSIFPHIASHRHRVALRVFEINLFLVIVR